MTPYGGSCLQFRMDLLERKHPPFNVCYFSSITTGIPCIPRSRRKSSLLSFKRSQSMIPWPNRGFSVALRPWRLEMARHPRAPSTGIIFGPMQSVVQIHQRFAAQLVMYHTFFYCSGRYQTIVHWPRLRFCAKT